MAGYYKVVGVNSDHVTRGVLDKDLHLEKDLIEVTYDDVYGTRHTIAAHKGGPFTSPEAIVEAHQDGTLHTFDSHQDAATVARDKGEHEFAERLEALSSSGQNGSDQSGFGG